MNQLAAETNRIPRVRPTGDRGSIPDSDIPKWLKRVVSVPLASGYKSDCHGSTHMANIN